MTSTTNRVIFYILLGVFFVIFFLATNNFYEGSATKQNIILITAGITFSLVFVGYAQLSGIFEDSSGYSLDYCPSPEAKLCRGGPYMWQGDSNRAKFCRNLASSKNGQELINSYECGAGYSGTPGDGFNFTPLSNGCWHNEQCDSPASCDMRPNGVL